MLQSPLVATGHGYEQSERGRCTAFDGLEIIANPLGGFDNASRESRIFRPEGGKPGSGVCYGSHALYLMRKADADKRDRGLYVGVHHGGGRQVWALPACYYYLNETADALAAMPERALYSLLHGIADTLDNAKRATERDTADTWRRATVDKRVRVSRQPAKGRAFVWIEPERIEGESDAQHNLRCQLAKPSGVR